ncbi:MAG: helix-turn-helix domain-containing protein [Thiomicrospira sp.]
MEEKVIDKKESGFPITEDEKKGFANRLSSLLDHRGLNQFAKECGLSEGTIRNILKNAALPRLDNLISMANAAGVTVEWLATGRGAKTYEGTDSQAVSLPTKPKAEVNQEQSYEFKKAVKPIGIHERKAARIIDLMIAHEFIKKDWRAPIESFVYIYNMSADEGLTDYAIVKAILETLIKHFEGALVSISILIDKGQAEPSLADFHTAKLAELRHKLEVLNQGGLNDVGLFDF